MINFSDVQLQQCYERNYAGITGFSHELCEVCALVATHDFFELLEGPASTRAQEATVLLLGSALRAALREWYAMCGTDMNIQALAFRDRLNQLSGERLQSSLRDPLTEIAA
jgi:hypothetical protein